MRRKGLLVGTFGIVALAAALLTPELDPAVPPSAGRPPFVWNQDDLWTGLEERFDRARQGGCEASGLAIDEGLAGIDRTLDGLDVLHGPADPVFRTLEGQLFEVAPLLGACPARLSELTRRVTRLRRVLKRQSRAWDPDDDDARATLYRLLYGSRAALEELILQAPEAAAEDAIVMRGVDEPSETPSFEFRGITLHSGDVLLSRGGAPTSALIARGNDRPGNFSHVALLHVSDDGTPTIIESHIERGVVTSTAEQYLDDVKLRIMVLRLRADHPALEGDPMLPHRAATAAVEAARSRHIPYDFAMDWTDPSAQFCSEVASAAYASEGVRLWRGLSSFSSPGLDRWLAGFGVRYFETHAPSDLEYDPQVRVVVEYRAPDTLFDDHLDGAVVDVMLEGAEAGDEVGYDYAQLPLARLAKAYSAVLVWLGDEGPIPEGMSATVGLRVEWLRQRHAAIRERLEARVDDYRAVHRRRPPYWTLVQLAREAERDLPPPD